MTDPCYSDPTGDSCSSFVRAEADVLADLSAVCSADSNLMGCTLWGQCQVGEARGLGVHGCAQALGWCVIKARHAAKVCSNLGGSSRAAWLVPAGLYQAGSAQGPLLSGCVFA